MMPVPPNRFETADEGADNGPAHVRTRRKCLRCETEFDSAWAGERICPHCKSTSAWRSGQPAPLPSRSGK